MSKRRPKNRGSKDQDSDPSLLKPGDIELELGVPIPGVILEPAKWVSAAIHRLPDGVLNPSQIFGRTAPLVIDIGCGNGRFAISSSVRRPECDHLGIDLLPMVIRYATRRARQRGLANCRFAVCDGKKFLSQHVAAGSASEIHVYHPQPYHDHTESHMRLLTPEFFGWVHRTLASQGKFFLQTDNQAYWDYLCSVMHLWMHWHVQNEPWPEDPYGRSRREFIAQNQGLRIHRGWGVRRDELSEEQLTTLLAEMPLPDRW